MHIKDDASQNKQMDTKGDGVIKWKTRTAVKIETLCCRSGYYGLRFKDPCAKCVKLMQGLELLEEKSKDTDYEFTIESMFDTYFYKTSIRFLYDNATTIPKACVRGFIVMEHKKNGENYMAALFVDPNMRRRGFASKLVQLLGVNSWHADQTPAAMGFARHVIDNIDDSVLFYTFVVHAPSKNPESIILNHELTRFFGMSSTDPSVMISNMQHKGWMKFTVKCMEIGGDLAQVSAEKLKNNTIKNFCRVLYCKLLPIKETLVNMSNTRKEHAKKIQSLEQENIIDHEKYTKQDELDKPYDRFYADVGLFCLAIDLCVHLEKVEDPDSGKQLEMYTKGDGVRKWETRTDVTIEALCCRLGSYGLRLKDKACAKCVKLMQGFEKKEETSKDTELWFSIEDIFEPEDPISVRFLYDNATTIPEECVRGFIVMQHKKNGENYMDALFVDPDIRKRGFASELVKLLGVNSWHVADTPAAMGFARHVIDNIDDSVIFYTFVVHAPSQNTESIIKNYELTRFFGMSSTDPSVMISNMQNDDWMEFTVKCMEIGGDLAQVSAEKLQNNTIKKFCKDLYCKLLPIKETLVNMSNTRKEHAKKIQSLEQENIIDHEKYTKQDELDKPYDRFYADVGSFCLAMCLCVHLVKVEDPDSGKQLEGAAAV